jgi:3'(2'), 5'-bisphosphate nucleotidase
MCDGACHSAADSAIVPMVGLKLPGTAMPTFDPAACSALLQALTVVAVSGALAVLRVAGSGGVRIKADGSPVTAADEASESAIRAGLERLAPGIAVISEETDHDRTAATDPNVILVDPLDGTRDFIAGRDEYTVNIALVTDGVPRLGVIIAPALGLIWRGIVGAGAECMQLATDGKTSPPRAIQARRMPARNFVVMVSRSHLEPQTQAYLDRLPEAKIVPCGSALKFCRLAEGTADHYPRLAPTCDWDVAAGHAILTAAGGSVVSPSGDPIAYGTAELRIPGFFAWGNRNAPNQFRPEEVMD